MKKLLDIRKGIISFVTLLVLMGVGVLGIGMVITSQLSSTSANNFRHKIQTFNAADGMMTLLAQDMLDFKDSLYFGVGGPLDSIRSSADVGTCMSGGSYTYNAGSQRVIGSGGDIQGTSDNMRFAYGTLSGNCNLIVKVVSLTNANAWSKAGIMIRQSLNANSQNVMALTTPIAANGVNFQSRKTAGATTNWKNVALTPPFPVWLGLSRSGNIFTGTYSKDSSTWTTINKDTITMTDLVYAGLAVTAHDNTKLDTAFFSSLTGMSFRSFTDTVNVGKDSIPVIYNLIQLGTNLFSMSTDSYILKGTTQGRNYETHLTQTLSREASGQWHETVHDSAYIPVVFYDFRANLTNPEFNMGATDMAMKGMVQCTLDAQRKPVPNKNNALRTCILNWYNSNWYNSGFTPNQRLTAWSNAANNYTTFASCTTSNHQGWCFSDSLKWWFRPRGGTGASFDSLNNVWRNLKHRPKWNSATGKWSDSVSTEYVGTAYDSTDPYANVVIYDSLKFRETGTNTGIFTFGDSLNSISKDIQWFDTATGFYRFVKFMPLKQKGYKYDASIRYMATNPYGCPVPACTTQQNFSFSMEMHRKFTYKPGQTFNFSGDDDVWAFINNQLVIDLGGVHKIMSASVNLDTVGAGVSQKLVSGQEYWFDFFYCERNVCESDILITTNMMFYIPPQPLKRSWARDYGNLN